MVGQKCLKVAGFGVVCFLVFLFFYTLPRPLVISTFGRLKADAIILVTGKQCENSEYMSQ